MREKELLWEMFVKTGNPSYYSLYKKLGADDRED